MKMLFCLNLNGEKFLRLVVHGPIEDLKGLLRLELEHPWCPLCDEEAQDKCWCRL
jgi:hypothetical protein